jgi:hypothetical protein
VPALSPNDEFSNFEVWQRWAAGDPAVHGSYVREAYGRGLVISKKTGANPFKFGVVGGSDSHNGLSVSDAEPYGDLAMAGKNAFSILARGNLTGVWAEQNTRESIYSALRRKETFATSGTRLKLRFFAGWRYPHDLLNKDQWIQAAYALGVPMGGRVAVHTRQFQEANIRSVGTQRSECG